jgi:acyl-coenzyme A synthetase/AMP-(fatty) acid ligase
MSKLPLMSRGLNEAIAWREGRTITAAEFIYQARWLAEQLRREQHVINLCQDRHTFSLAFAASILANTTTLLPANRLPDTIDVLVNRYPGSLIISDQPIEGLYHRLLDPGQALDQAGQADRIPVIDESLLAAVVFTSGSTGPSSAVRKPWRTLHDSSLINAAEYGPCELTYLVATVPPQHMWGLETSVLLPWFGPAVIASAQPFYAADIIALLERLQRPRTLISTPVHLRNLAESGLDLPALDRIYSATAPLGAKLAGKLERLTSAEVTEVFGCSEAGCLARRRVANDEPWRLFDAFSLLEQQGRFRVRAAHLPEPVELLDHLDIGTDGRFRLAGRNSDLVNIAGKRASLAELTQRLLDISGVTDGVIFQPPDSDDGRVSRLAALVVAPQLSERQIRQALSQRIDPAFMPRPLRRVPALPRAESGKLPHQSLVHFYRQVCEPAR